MAYALYRATPADSHLVVCYLMVPSCPQGTPDGPGTYSAALSSLRADSAVFAGYDSGAEPGAATRIVIATDQGQRVSEPSTPVPEMVASSGAAFLDENIGWIVGNNREQHVLAKTTDGGASWHIQRRTEHAACRPDDVNFAVGGEGATAMSTVALLVRLREQAAPCDLDASATITILNEQGAPMDVEGNPASGRLQGRHPRPFGKPRALLCLERLRTRRRSPGTPSSSHQRSRPRLR